MVNSRSNFSPPSPPSPPAPPAPSRLPSAATPVSYLLQPLLYPAVPAVGGHISASIPGNNNCLARGSHERRVQCRPVAEPEVRGAGGCIAAEPAPWHSGNCSSGAPVGPLVDSGGPYCTRRPRQTWEFPPYVNHLSLASY